MYFREEEITPEIATDYLSHNKNNRNIRWADVDKYARDMKAGEWELTPECIAFGTKGQLKNGQHRLNAVIKAGVPVTFIVAYDVPDEITIFDRGVLRTAADILKMSGLNDASSTTNMDSLVNFLFRLGNIKKPSDKTKITFITEFEDDLVKALSIASSKTGKQQNCRKSPVIAAIFCALRCGLSEQGLREFVSIANEGFTSSPSKYAAIVLRNYIKQEYTGISTAERTKLFMVATNAIKDFAAGNPRKQIYKSNAKPCFWDHVKKNDMDKYLAEYKK